MTDIHFDPATLAMNSKDKGSLTAIGNRPAIMEPKYDGIRLLIHVSENGVRAYARSGNSKTGKLPAIEAELAANLPVGTWLDGEAVEFNPDGTQNWGGAQSVLGSGTAKAAANSGAIRFVIFDLIAFDGTDARSLPLRHRRELLESLFASEGGRASWDRCLLSLQLEPSEETHAALLDLGFEGSMIKLLDAPYASGKRSASSLKMKAVDTVDAIVTGSKPGKPGSWIEQAGLIGALTFVHYDENGREIEGACSGMTVPRRREMTEAFKAGRMLGEVIEVSYMTKMDGVLRHPQYQRTRDDKSAAEIHAEADLARQSALELADEEAAGDRLNEAYGPGTYV